MKAVFSFVAIILLALTSGNVYAFDYQFGTQVEITHNRDYSQWQWQYGFVRSHENVARELDMMSRHPVLSPDGGDVAFSNDIGIWLVSSRGGEPELLFDTVLYIETEDKRPIQNCRTLSFTPDGNEVTFMYYIFDEEYGSNLRMRDDSNEVYVEYPFPVIASVDINTGEVSTVVNNAWSGYWSPDGKRFVFDRKSSDPHAELEPVIKDMETEEESYPDYEDDYSHLVAPGFSQDGGSIYYSAADSDDTMQVYRSSIEDDDYEMLSNFEEETEAAEFALSPDQQWFLYTGIKPPEELLTSPRHIYTIYAYNTISGETVNIMPSSQNSTSYSLFSRDGSQFSFVLFESTDDQKRLFFIKDFDLGSVHVADKTPESISLIHIFPNPFNPTTTIEFTLPSTGFAELAIYNTAGQKIRTLVVGDLISGTHALEWNGKNDNGETVSSGVYISRLSAGNTTIAKRMTLIK